MADVSVSGSRTHLSDEARDAIADRLETLWGKYIDGIHRFITLSTSLIAGLAGFVSFLPKCMETTVD